MAKDNGRNPVPKESSELIARIKDFGISVMDFSVNPIHKNNYENKFLQSKNGDYLNINYGGHSHKVYISPNGYSFKEYQRKVKKLMDSLR